MDLRRTIEELHALYKLESELRGVFVEGATDKAFFDWYLHRKKWPHASVYSIDLVDVPNALVLSYGLPLGSSRSRVVALSLELARLFPRSGRIMCIIDRDTDDSGVLAKLSPHLYLTDGNALEVYALTPAVLKKFLLVCLGGFPRSSEDLMAQIVPVLQRLYLIRRANTSLDWGMAWIPFNGYVCLDGGEVEFRESDFVRAYLQKNDRWSSRRKFAEALDEEARKLDPDPRRSIRGHDLSELLRHILLKVRKSRVFGNSETVEGCLMATIETSDLDGQSLFESLKQIMTI